MRCGLLWSKRKDAVVGNRGQNARDTVSIITPRLQREATSRHGQWRLMRGTCIYKVAMKSPHRLALGGPSLRFA